MKHKKQKNKSLRHSPLNMTNLKFLIFPFFFNFRALCFVYFRDFMLYNVMESLPPLFLTVYIGLYTYNCPSKGANEGRCIVMFSKRISFVVFSDTRFITPLGLSPICYSFKTNIYTYIYTTIVSLSLNLTPPLFDCKTPASADASAPQSL